MEQVILVDQEDHQIGLMEKLEAHKKGLLHRAFSVFVFNDQNQLLLQQRAKSKYHSGGLWTNTCCSHPRENESIVDAGQRRLFEEMGFSVPLTAIFSFIYRADLDNDLIEHEFDHVLIGKFNDPPVPNLTEVEDFRFVDLAELSMDISKQPERYTVWFRIIFERVKNHLIKSLNKNESEN